MNGSTIRPAPGSPLLDLAAIAERWGCCTDTARKSIERLQIPLVPVVRAIRVRLADIEAAELGSGVIGKRKG